MEQQPNAILPLKEAAPSSVRDRASEVLRQAGLLVELGWEEPPPVSDRERAELARRLGQQGSLSEVVIQERESGW